MRAGLFDATIDRRVVARASRLPFTEAARTLLVEGVDPKIKLVIRHKGASHDALVSTISVAAIATGGTAGPETGKAPSV
jgi:hypothetical protein